MATPRGKEGWQRRPLSHAAICRPGHTGLGLALPHLCWSCWEAVQFSGSDRGLGARLVAVIRALHTICRFLNLIWRRLPCSLNRTKSSPLMVPLPAHAGPRGSPVPLHPVPLRAVGLSFMPWAGVPAARAPGEIGRRRGRNRVPGKGPWKLAGARPALGFPHCPKAQAGCHHCGHGLLCL